HRKDQHPRQHHDQILAEHSLFHSADFFLCHVISLPWHLPFQKEGGAAKRFFTLFAAAPFFQSLWIYGQLALLVSTLASDAARHSSKVMSPCSHAAMSLAFSSWKPPHTSWLLPRVTSTICPSAA